MEFGILIGIIVVGLGLYMWNTRKREEVVTKSEESAPYKVEPVVAEPAPAPVAPPVEQPAEPITSVIEAAPAKKPARSKAVAGGKKTAAKKPRAKKA